VFDMADYVLCGKYELPASFSALAGTIVTWHGLCVRLVHNT